MSELKNIQKWFTSILVKPGQLDEKIMLADNCYCLHNNDVISSTDSLSARQRIWIYAGGYQQRLLECMEAEYPVLFQLLGEDLFHTFARAYLLHFPSGSPDLYDLGHYFPAYLKASQPENNNPAYSLPVDIAYAERAIAEAAREQGTEKEEDNTLQNEHYFFMQSAYIQASPCLKLLRSNFSIVDYIHNIQCGKEEALPESRDCLIAITRKKYAVSINEVALWQWLFLQAMQAGNNYMEAVTLTAEKLKYTTDSVLADLMLWLPTAVSIGYLYLPKP